MSRLITETGWDEILKDEYEKPYYKKLTEFVEKEYELANQGGTQIYPLRDEVFTAFRLTDFSQIKVIIIGQDPYHEPGQAHGLAFSVKSGVKLPPSLRNIYKEIKSEFGDEMPLDGCLTKWAMQGVFLLNNCLTVRAHEAGSHRKKGWELFTDAVITAIDKSDRPMAFLLWGNDAIQKKELINNPAHLVLTSVHPSPLSASRGFFGCDHFKKANSFLESQGISPIDWSI